MKLVLVITLFFALAFAGCRCPGSCGSGYRGSIVDCYCWCQRTANSLKASSDAKCSHFPSGSYSSGGCSLCASNINSLTGETSAAEVFEKSLSDALIGVETNSGMIFPVRRCRCHDGTCDWGYSGTSSQCSAWARSQSSRFINGQYTVSFFPRGMYSSGGCSVCGQTDPCKSF
ncbi:hypothetical protein GEMRC1_012112 [Eukaryota sp. GEM-RC1]